MQDRRAPQFQQLLDRAIHTPGTLAEGVRKAAAAGHGVPEVLAAYVTKVHQHAYEITDDDVAALKKAGYSEDQIFELTVAAAVGAGMERHAAGMAAINGGK